MFYQFFKNILLLLLLTTSSLLVIPGFCHCQIPCGIYGDKHVFEEIKMDIETVEKSMKEIKKFSKDPEKNANQLVRWIVNKENHANNIMKTISEYFLAQRIKIPKDETNEKEMQTYSDKLQLLHAMIIAAMQSKQTTDLTKPATLKT